jgi:uncharacterized repeat protein (TIGR01451 family)
MRKLNSARRLVSLLAISLFFAVALALLVTSMLFGPPLRMKGVSAQVETPTPNTTNTPTPAATPTVNPNCDLIVSKIDNPDPVAEGAQITYTITVENDGSAGQCNDLEVTDIIPDDTDCSDASVDSSSDIAPGDFDISGCDTSGDVVWTTDSNLDTGDSVELTMVVQLTSGASEGDHITNEACAMSTDDADGDCDSASTTVGPPRASGSISGTVRDENGNPIESCGLCANEWTYGGGGCGYTDSDGSYTIAGLGTADYRVDVNCDGYVGEYYDDVRTSNDASPVHVVEGQNTEGIDFSLESGGSISGTVRDSLGDPIEDITVRAYYEPDWNMNGSDETDAEGNYEITGLEGAYIVQTDSDEYADEYYDNKPSEDQADTVNVDSGQAVSGIDFSLGPTGSISGIVSDAGGDPIEGAQILACPQEGGDCGDAASAADGSYTITGLNYLHYIVEATGSGYAREYYDGVSHYADATPVDLSEANLIRTGIDLQLDLQAIICGTVTAGGNPISGAWILVEDRNDSWSTFFSTSSGTGTYSVPNLPAGSYRVIAQQVGYASEYYQAARWAEDATNVVVGIGETTSNIDLTLEAGGGISGAVTDLNHNPVAGAKVYANPQNHDEPWWWSVLQGWMGNRFIAITGADGTYNIVDLGEGAYTVRVKAGGYATTYYASPVSVVGGSDTPNIDFELSLLGDGNGNGQVSMVDAMLTAQYVAGLIGSGALDLTAADVNCSGGVSMVDAMLVAQKVAGLISDFPACGP